MMRRVTLNAALAILLLQAVSAAAQTLSGGSIRGYVKDQQALALPGVAVTGTSPDAPGVYKAVTDDSGVYRLVDLPPGTYTVTAELTGFTKFVRPNIVVRAGLNLGVDVVMTIGAITEITEVKADTPLIESRTAEQTVNISGDLQRHVPLSTRHAWTDALVLTPGTVSKENRDGLSFFLHGADGSSLVMQFDGADVGSALQSGNFYVNLGNEAIGDVQVKTGAVDASTPLGQGAIINVAMKSGTNLFKGSAASIYQPWRFNANNGPAGTTTSAFRLFQADASLGGPIQRDRLWFFGSGRYKNDSLGIDRTATQLAIMRALVPDFTPYTLDNASHEYVVKVSAQLGRHQLSGFAQNDSFDYQSGSATSGANYLTRFVGGYAGSVRASSVWGRSVTTQMTASYNNKGVSGESIRNDIPERDVYTSTFASGGRLFGTGFSAILDNFWNVTEAVAQKMTLKADMTWVQNAFGSHEIQTGVFAQPRLRNRTITHWTNGGYVLEDVVLRDPGNPAGGTIPFRRRYVTELDFTSAGNDGQVYAFYVQDAWRPLSRLAVSAGVRIDHIRRRDFIFDLETQRSVSVGPRLGVNYGLTADGRNVVRASWVRVHDVATQTTQNIGSSTQSATDQYDTNLDGTFETTFFTPGVTAQTANRRLDSSRNQPYLNEWIVGYRRQLAGQTTVDVSVIRREFRERAALLDINGIYENGVFRGYRDVAFNEILSQTNNIWNWPVYTGLELQATKQTSRIQMLAGYTRQWRHMEGTWQPNDPASFIQPDAFPNDKGIGFTAGGAAAVDSQNSLSGGIFTPTQQWVDHVVRAGGSVRGPWGTMVATNYTFQSGLWVGPIVKRIAAADPQFGPPTVTLSNGRVVSNPLATTIRFAFPTRGEGQLKSAPINVWNVRLGRNFQFGTRRLETAVDIFNVINAGEFQAWNAGSNQLYSSNYNIGQQRQQPRAAQLWLRFAF